jgi:hypothetical protein
MGIRLVDGIGEKEWNSGIVVLQEKVFKVQLTEA